MMVEAPACEQSRGTDSGRRLLRLLLYRASRRRLIRRLRRRRHPADVAEFFSGGIRRRHESRDENTPPVRVSADQMVAPVALEMHKAGLSELSQVVADRGRADAELVGERRDGPSVWAQHHPKCEARGVR